MGVDFKISDMNGGYLFFLPTSKFNEEIQLNEIEALIDSCFFGLEMIQNVHAFKSDVKFSLEETDGRRNLQLCLDRFDSCRLIQAEGKCSEFQHECAKSCG